MMAQIRTFESASNPKHGANHAKGCEEAYHDKAAAHRAHAILNLTYNAHRCIYEFREASDCAP